MAAPTSNGATMVRFFFKDAQLLRDKRSNLKIIIRTRPLGNSRKAAMTVRPSLQWTATSLATSCFTRRLIQIKNLLRR